MNGKSEGTKPGRPSLTLLVLGGLLMIVGPMLSYLDLEFEVPSSESLKGLDTDDGKLFLAIGVLALLTVLIVVVSQSSRVRRFLGLVIVLFAGLLLYAGVADIGSAEDDAIEGLSEASGTDVQVIEDQTSVGVGMGLYLSTIGAGGALLGSAGLLLGRGRERAPVLTYEATQRYAEQPTIESPMSPSDSPMPPPVESPALGDMGGFRRVDRPETPREN